MKKIKHSGKVVAKKNNLKLIDCIKCGFFHFYPYPKNEEIEKYYKNSFYQKTKTDYFSSFEKDKDWYNLHYNLKYIIFEKYVKYKHKSIIDIGSGPGLFLNVGKKRNWKVKGIEPSPEAYKYSIKKYNIPVINEFIENIQIDQISKFDVINLSFVLEHLIDPSKVIDLAKKILKKRGIISIEVPNDFNFLQNIYTKDKNIKYWISYPDHINYFNVFSLEHFLKKFGFKILHKYSSFPLEMFLLMDIDYIKNNKKNGSKIHTFRKNFEFKFKKQEENLLKIYENFAKINLGREVTIIAQKLN